jgi:pimeloyl-ACP methyl ester carboxylesterase
MSTFSVEFEQFTLRGDYLPGNRRQDVLVLHGAGQSQRARLAMVRASLQQRDIGTTAFDFIGHGETGGQLTQSSVASRTRQTQAVIAARQLRQPLAVIGFSMGASNAIALAQSGLVSSLILIVPGVYIPEANDVPFGPQFSEIIRRDRSWEHTDAWDILAQFRGRLLVIAAENDVVIPREIPERLVASAVNASWRKLLVVERAEHTRLFSLLKEEEPARYEEVFDLIAECIGIDNDEV